MIYNVSYRTDVPAFFWPWWERRLEEGFFEVRNPYYPEKVSRQSLDPEVVDGIQYISKNFEPALDGQLMPLKKAAEMYPSRFEATVNAYGKDIERHVPGPMTKRIDIIKRLAQDVGPEAISWNYNPILIDAKHNVAFHMQALELMFEAIAPHVSGFSFDFVNMHAKTIRNAPDIRPPDATEIRIICDHISDLVGEYGLVSHTCNDDRVRKNIPMRSCQTTRDFMDISNRIPKKRINESILDDCIICGNKVPHRDVGTYDTCLHGCTYCYANDSDAAVHATASKYDQTSTMLCDSRRDDDIFFEPKPKACTMPSL